MNIWYEVTVRRSGRVWHYISYTYTQARIHKYSSASHKNELPPHSLIKPMDHFATFKAIVAENCKLEQIRNSQSCPQPVVQQTRGLEKLGIHLGPCHRQDNRHPKALVKSIIHLTRTPTYSHKIRLYRDSKGAPIHRFCGVTDSSWRWGITNINSSDICPSSGLQTVIN